MHIADTTNSPHARLRSVPASAVTITDEFWEPRRRINRDTTLLNQFRHIEETGRLDNFRRASGRKTGIEFQGIFFNDSDVYKWLEAAVIELPNASPELAEAVRITMDEIVAAQQPDGYLNTYFMFDNADQRYTNLKDMHELYCAGHFLQAAVAHHRTTGETILLDAAARLADHICDVFGPDGRAGACGHEEIELALVEFSRATGDTKYLIQAQRFVDLRGSTPSVIATNESADRRYMQDHVPYRELGEVTGHAVRMMYLATAAADIYLETGEQALWDAMMRQWENMTQRRMYVSGGLGARYEGEAFGKDYELPNERAYAETCAAIGGIMWNWRLLLATGDAKFADCLELMLYNAALAGLSLDGQLYFYQNPLADSDGTHRRKPWFGCACCPPNIARLLAQLPGYIYTTDDAGGIYLHLYAQNRATIPLPDGRTVTLDVKTRYPFDSDVEITVLEGDGDITLHLRIPDWIGAKVAGVDEEMDASLLLGEELEPPTVTINGEPAEVYDVEGDLSPQTYFPAVRVQTSDVVRLTLPMPVRTIEAHPHIAENPGRVAIFRGPLLYCAESCDNPLFHDLRNPLNPDDESDWELVQADDFPAFVVALRKPAVLLTFDAPDALYSQSFQIMDSTDDQVTLIPYFAWANREPAGQMQVWFWDTPA